LVSRYYQIRHFFGDFHLDLDFIAILKNFSKSESYSTIESTN